MFLEVMYGFLNSISTTFVSFRSSAASVSLFLYLIKASTVFAADLAWMHRPSEKNVSHSSMESLLLTLYKRSMY